MEFKIEAVRHEYAELTIEADSYDEAVELAEEYDEYDFNWYGSDIDYEVFEVK
jgi:hypothetical protein